MKHGGWSRRRFLSALGAGATLSACGKAGLPPVETAGQQIPEGVPPPPPGAPRAEDIHLPAGGSIPRRTLGSTGLFVSTVGIGGFHMGIPRDEQTSIRIVRMAIDHGVNFLDNCWSYHGGESERRMGKALEGGYRQKVVLMTKLDGRTRQAAAGQLEQSLRRLRTDCIDVVQIHEVIRPWDPAHVFGPDGAIEALVAAQKAGKLRYIGFTGHKDPAYHLLMLKTALEHGFRFDTVQMPLNVMDASYDSFEQNVLPVLLAHDIGVLGMKPIGSGVLLASGAVTARECLRYAIDLPTDVVITGCDSIGVLKQALDVAMRFRPLTEEARLDLLLRAKPSSEYGMFEWYKTTERFDSTTQNPRWLVSDRL